MQPGKLIKIKQVVLYTALTEDAAECFQCKKLLDDNKIKYTLLHYGDESTHQQNFDALSTWSWGGDFRQVKFTKFPIIHWTEYYDDYERYMEVAVGLEELQASNLIKNASLVS
jgi:hypothetical protein